jgi:hypothetical protein
MTTDRISEIKARLDILAKMPPCLGKPHHILYVCTECYEYQRERIPAAVNLHKDAKGDIEHMLEELERVSKERDSLSQDKSDMQDFMEHHGCQEEFDEWLEEWK